MYKHNSKERKAKVTVTVQLEHSLGHWLRMNISDLNLVFDFSPMTHNLLHSVGFERLGDIILFSRKELSEGTLIPIEEFESLNFLDRRRIEYLEGEGTYKNHLVGPGKPRYKRFGPVSMKEIDDMFQKLGLKFRGE